MAKDPNPNLVKSKKRFRYMVAVFIVGAFIFKMSFVFFFIGMIPAFVAYVVDNDKHKYIFSTVFALNFAGVFPFMMDILWHGGHFDAVQNKLSDMVVWFAMYGSAGLGWALVWLSPIIAAATLEGLYRGRILHLETLQKKAVEEWGEEVKGKRSKEEEEG